MLTIKKGKARVAKYVSLLIFIVLIAEQCVSSNNLKSKNRQYNIRRYNSTEKLSYIKLKFYDYENKKKPIPAVYRVNGIIFGATNKVKNDILYVRPGKYYIEAGFVGKSWISAPVKVSKGDSLIVKMYLKNSPKPLH